MNSYVDGGAFARRTISCNSEPCSAPGSPKSRVKFLCSHGGRIFPRPSDGQLKYVGGETRVISVPMDISFQELMKRLTYLIDGEMILKYQLVAEDLDALVSVKCDEDLAHMFEEMEHYQVMGYPRMRTFLFPINHVMMENPIEQLPLDQRYIFSINGIIFPKHHPTMSTKHVGLRSVASSACTSPRSPESSATEVLNSDNPWLHTPNDHQNTTNMPKIHSSPSICNLNLNVPQQSNQYSYQIPPQYNHNSTTSQASYHGHSSYKSPNLQPFDTHNQRSVALDRVVSMRSGGRGDGARFQPDSAPPSYNYASSRDQNRGGSGYCSNCMHHDNCAHFLDRRSIDRQGTLP